jgi:hypothetical protein
MKKFSLTLFVSLILILSSSLCFAAGRLNFMLTNLSELAITEVYIAPSMYPEYITENLLNTTLDPSTRVYIGPNYYGDQRYWNITVGWSNGYKHTFVRARLTRYNSYVIWNNYAGIHMQQGYERAYARYSSYPPQHIYTGARGYEVYVGIPEKVNYAYNRQPQPSVNPLAQPQQQQQQQQQAPQQNQGNQAANNAPSQPAAPDNFQVAANNAATRDLVFEDDDDSNAAPAVEGTDAAGASGEKIAVKATVELTRDGKTTTVLPTDSFKSGDRVRLLFSANRDGYVYWLTKGSSGQYQILFPSAKTGQDNKIKKNAENTIPVKGAWRFDDNKGIETLVCILSPDRVASVDEAIKLAESGDESGSSKIVASLVDGHETKRTTTRDLVFEEEDEGDVNTKTQTTSDGEPFVATYELEHI